MMTLYTGIEVTKNVFGSLCTSKLIVFVHPPGVPPTNSGLLFMPLKIQTDGKKF